MITPITFKDRFQEFLTIPDTTIQMLLDEAYLIISENPYQDYMVLYWAAHNLTIQQTQIAGNAQAMQTIASESVGNVSTSYANSNIDNGAFTSTSYGQKYLEYKKTLCVGNVKLV